MKKGLGRGLESLFNVYNEFEDETSSQPRGVTTLPAKEETVRPVGTETVSHIVPQRNCNINEDAQTDEKVYQLDLELIDPNANQPRKHFDQDALNELADSMQTLYDYCG